MKPKNYDAAVRRARRLAAKYGEPYYVAWLYGKLRTFDSHGLDVHVIPDSDVIFCTADN